MGLILYYHEKWNNLFLIWTPKIVRDWREMDIVIAVQFLIFAVKIDDRGIGHQTLSYQVGPGNETISV